jgi:hypothetical protein
MHSLSGELTVILISVWWLQKLGSLAINKQLAQNSEVERYNLRKLNELEVRKEYQIEISNRFAALENLSDSEDINRAWKNIKRNIKRKSRTVRIKAI